MILAYFISLQIPSSGNWLFKQFGALQSFIQQDEIFANWNELLEGLDIFEGC